MKITPRSEHDRAAFSLVELMVVVVIIGLLATLVVPNVIDRLKMAKEKIALGQIAILKEALDSYLLDHGNYPRSLKLLVVADEGTPRYLDKKHVPLDPWGNAYRYAPPEDTSGELILCSLGSDGCEGGTEHAADIHWDPDE